MMKFKNILPLMLVLFLFACQNKEASAPKDANSETKTYTVRVYRPSYDYIVNGKEDDELLGEDFEVNGSLIDAVDKIIQTLYEDSESPKDKACFAAIPKDVKISSKSFDKGLLTIDFSKKDLAGSSFEENILIKSLISSLFSLKEIDEIKITVDGKDVETLMGHVDISENFRRFK